MPRHRAHDFTELADYKAAIRLLRKFCPEKFNATAYPLRGFDDIKQLSRYKREQVREYTRFIRPLVVYGYKVQRVKNPDELARRYQALYGLADIPPALKTIPMPVNRDNERLPVKYEQYTYTDDDSDYSGAFTLARVEVAPGVKVARLHFSDIGVDFSDLIGGNINEIVGKIFDTFKPTSVALQAGVSVVKKDGAPFLFDTPGQFANYIAKMQGRYSNEALNNHFSNWMHGVDLYYMESNKQTSGFMRDEMARYKERKALAAKLKWQRDKRKQYENRIKEVERNVKALSRSADDKERAAIRRNADKVIAKYNKKIARADAQVQKLAGVMYRTESF